MVSEPKGLGDETRMEYLMEEKGQPTKRKLKVTKEEVSEKTENGFALLTDKLVRESILVYRRCLGMTILHRPARVFPAP